MLFKPVNVRLLVTCKLSLLTYKAFLVGKPSLKGKRKTGLPLHAKEVRPVVQLLKEENNLRGARKVN